MYDNNISTKSQKNKRPNQTKQATNRSQSAIQRKSGKAQRRYSRVNQKDKPMFSSDIDARRNAIEKDKLEETKRHNKAQESYERPAKIMSGIGAIARGLNPFKVSGKIGNHPSWYLQDTSLAAQSTAISDKVPIGKNQKIITLYRSANTKYDFGSSEAVFIAYDYAPIVSLYDGKVTDNIDELNAAIYDKAPNYISKALYTAVKAACRRNLPYSPSDVIRTILVVMDIFCNIEVVKRVYRVANTYKFTNQTVGQHLVEALGFKYNQVRENLADILFRVNRLGKMLASVHIPKGQTLLDRWLLLAGAIFKDRDCDRSRLFGFRKRVMYLNVQGDVEGTIPRMLAAKTLEGLTSEDLSYDVSWTTTQGFTGWSYAKVLDAIEAQIYSLLNNSDILACLADINTAFEAKGFWEFIPLQADEQQEFGYDEIMISQVRNSILCGRTYFGSTEGKTFNASNFDVYDVGNGNILQGYGENGYVYPVMFWSEIPNVQTSTAVNSVVLEGSYTPRIGIDTPVDNPDAGILLTVSRLSPTLEDTVYVYDDGIGHFFGRVITSHGSEILLGMEYSKLAAPASRQAYEYRYIVTNLSTRNSVGDWLQRWAIVQCYNAVPRTFVAEMTSQVDSTAGGTLTVKIISNIDPFIVGDMTHVVYCDNSLVSRWHFIAVASEYALPNVMSV